jgi:hypothetical protein
MNPLTKLFSFFKQKEVQKQAQPYVGVGAGLRTYSLLNPISLKNAVNENFKSDSLSYQVGAEGFVPLIFLSDQAEIRDSAILNYTGLSAVAGYEYSGMFTGELGLKIGFQHYTELQAPRVSHLILRGKMFLNYPTFSKEEEGLRALKGTFKNNLSTKTKTLCSALRSATGITTVENPKKFLEDCAKANSEKTSNKIFLFKAYEEKFEENLNAKIQKIVQEGAKKEKYEDADVEKDLNSLVDSIVKRENVPAANGDLSIADKVKEIKDSKESIVDKTVECQNVANDSDKRGYLFDEKFYFELPTGEEFSNMEDSVKKGLLKATFAEDSQSSYAKKTMVVGLSEVQQPTEVYEVDNIKKAASKSSKELSDMVAQQKQSTELAGKIEKIIAANASTDKNDESEQVTLTKDLNDEQVIEGIKALYESNKEEDFKAAIAIDNLIHKESLVRMIMHYLNPGVNFQFKIGDYPVNAELTFNRFEPDLRLFVSVVQFDKDESQQ